MKFPRFKFPRLKLRARIYSGYAVLLALSVALSIYSIREFSSIGSRVSRIGMSALSTTRVIDIAHNFEVIRQRILFYTVYADDAAIKEEMDAEKASIDVMNGAIAAGRSPARKRTYEGILNGFKTIASKREALVVMIKTAQADKVKLVALGDQLALNTDKLIEAAQSTNDPSLISLAGNVGMGLLSVRESNWQFQATRDSKGPALFKVSAETAKGAITAFERSTLPDDLSGLIGPVKASLDRYAAVFADVANNLLKSSDLYDNDLRPQLVSMGKDLEKAQQSLQQDFESTSQESNEIIATTVTTQEVTAALAFLLSALIAYLVARSIARPVTGLTKAMERLAAGDNDTEIPSQDSADELGKMARAVLTIRDSAAEKAHREMQAMQERQQVEEEERRAKDEERRVKAEADARLAEEQAQVVRNLGNGLGKLAEGDLTFRLTDGFTETYQRIKDDFNSAIGRLQDTINAIAASTQEVANASSEISSSTTDLSQRTEEQAASIEETSASLEELTVTVRKNAENAQQANQLASGTREVASRGGEVVGEAVKAMSRIEDSSRKISDIIGVIDEIARQTNLLALNAAVEAARAGEAGRGFAVVASEVRSLAQRSAQAAKDIKDLIVSSSDQVRDGVDLVNRTGASLNEIVESIKQVADFVADIAHASSEQAIGLDEINKALTQMDTVTQQNSALVEENAATAKTLEHQSTAMHHQVGYFRLDEAAKEAAAAKPAAVQKHHVAARSSRKPVAVSRPVAALRNVAGRRGSAAIAAVPGEEF